MYAFMYELCIELQILCRSPEAQYSPIYFRRATTLTLNIKKNITGTHFVYLKVGEMVSFNLAANKKPMFGNIEGKYLVSHGFF